MKRELLLVGNYEPDAQMSMMRFANTLEAALRESGMHVRLLRPAVRLNRWRGLPTELRKWLGYLDKFVLFGRDLQREIVTSAARTGYRPLVHICDQGNALLVHYVQRTPHLITCHDLIAVLQARRKLSGPAVRFTGWLFQWLNVWSLEWARWVVCSSANTRSDLLAISQCHPLRTGVVRYQLNHRFQPSTPDEINRLVLPSLLGSRRPLILHVGNNVWYKNRDGVLRIFAELIRLKGDDGNRPRLVLIGDPCNSAQTAWIEANGLIQDVVCLPNQDSMVLQAYYSVAAVFLFPSKYEGFGWPPIEAQACGCPVVAGRAGALPEVLEDSAVLHEPADEAGMAASIIRLIEEPGERQKWVGRGNCNVGRFLPPVMIENYLSAYQQIA